INNWPYVLQHIYVILVVIFSWVFFRSETMTYAYEYIKTMLGFSNGDSNLVFVYLNNYTISLIVLALIFSMPIRRYFNGRISLLQSGSLKVTIDIGTKMFYIVLLIFSIIELAQSGYNPFI